MMMKAKKNETIRDKTDSLLKLCVESYCENEWSCMQCRFNKEHKTLTGFSLVDCAEVIGFERVDVKP